MRFVNVINCNKYINEFLSNLHFKNPKIIVYV